MLKIMQISISTEIKINALWQMSYAKRRLLFFVNGTIKMFLFDVVIPAAFLLLLTIKP